MVQIWDWATGALDSGPSAAENSISDFGNVIFPPWTSISFEKWWVWIWGCSSQQWYFITNESSLLLNPISIALKAHFFPFSPWKWLIAFPLAISLCIFTYLLVIMFSFHHLSTWMNDISYHYLQKFYLHLSLFSFMSTFWIQFPETCAG